MWFFRGFRIPCEIWWFSKSEKSILNDEGLILWRHGFPLSSYSDKNLVFRKEGFYDLSSLWNLWCPLGIYRLNVVTYYFRRTKKVSNRCEFLYKIEKRTTFPINANEKHSWFIRDKYGCQRDVETRWTWHKPFVYLLKTLFVPPPSTLSTYSLVNLIT